MNRFFTTIAIVLLATAAFSQQNIIDSFQANGIYRNFILHIPQGYDSAAKYPLVLNLHGFTSNANNQMTNTKMNDIADADSEPFFVVYPNGVNSSWEPLNTTVNDVSFLSALIDTIRVRYNIDSTAVFSCGFSNGGITTYLLACQLSNQIAAVASVSGTIAISTYNNCALSRKIPVMHIHGTADPVVGYTGNGLSAVVGLEPVETTVSFWVDTNDCSLNSDTTAIADTCLTDSSTVQLIRYRNCGNASEVYFYKITNGGHTWPGGADSTSSYGNINRDFSASQEIWNFFKRHKKGQDVLAVKAVNNLSANILPNPFENVMTISLSAELPTTISVFDISGKQIFREENAKQTTTIATTNWATGMYIVHLQNHNGTQVNRVIKE